MKHYPRPGRYEVEIGACKIEDARNKIIHEIRKAIGWKGLTGK